MKIVERYIDDLLDYFPVNSTTRIIRKDLLQAAFKDYRQLLKHGLSQNEASDTVIDQIEGPEVMAKMIPNKYSFTYYIFIFISFAICIGICEYIRRPDFLQIFLPARMIFPDIIERFIQYLMVLYICYVVLCQFIRCLPQKYLNRSLWQSMLLLYSGTIMSALYVSISIAFVWFSFNGYVDSEMINGGTSLHLLFNFYKAFIEPSSTMPIYALINASCFVFSKQYYHLDFSAEPYLFDEIYHSTQLLEEPTTPTIEVKEDGPSTPEDDLIKTQPKESAEESSTPDDAFIDSQATEVALEQTSEPENKTLTEVQDDQKTISDTNITNVKPEKQE